MGQRMALLLPATGAAARAARALGRPALAAKPRHQRLWVRLAASASAHGAADAAASAAAAVPPASSLGAPGAPAAAPAAAAPLSTAHLERFMAERGITGQVVPQLGGAPPPPNCCEVKSLVFLVDGQPIVVVLPLLSRVDERQLAALLHTGRNHVRLAPAEALPELCGYTVGNVPPFGHRRPLPVIVDSCVTAFANCYAGGGSDTAEILIAVPELLRATGATVADVALPARGTGASAGLAGSPSSSSGGVLPAPADEAAAAAPLEGTGAAAAAALPLPWQPGQTEVAIEGIVAHRRKIARLLLFANLVPLEPVEQAAAAFPASPKPGTASYMRRLWRSPGSGQPTEVQLILGATLGRNLGSKAAAELLRSLKTGQHVRVTGRVQPHLEKAGAPPRHRADICDVVVHSIELLEEPPALANTTGVAAAAAARLPRGAAAAAAAAAATATGAARTAADAPAAPCYQLPAAVQERMILVECEEGLALMERALFPGSSGGGTGSNGSSSGGASGSSGSVGETGGGSEPRGFGPAEGPFRLVVGIDCEWQPYSTRQGDAKTPVSLLQVATPDAVFLIDMLTLCNGGMGSSLDGGSSTAGSSSSSTGSGSGGEASPAGTVGSEGQGQQPARVLPPAQARLSALLARLFGDGSIVKAGFGLQTDLARLCESYPWLPCFGAEGPVPLRSHVDLLLLARTALGTALPQARRRISLARLAEAVLGRGLDKTEQTSAWGTRPLRRAQLLYAAADAHCLVALHRELNRRRAGLESHFWVSHFSGRLTDVAAFHPRNRRGSSDATSSGGSTSSAVRRSSVSWRDRHAQRLAEGGAAVAVGRSQTQQLDINLEYLANTYLGRQLPQGGKVAVVRAAAAHTGRPQAGQTPRFPRGCGGLLEWRNGFTLFVNLPESLPEAAGRAASGGRAYPNEFFWLPPLGTAGAAGAAGVAGAADEVAEADAVPASRGGAGLWRQGWRLCLTWWPGRGQTGEHPVIQRLLAAGSAGTPPAAAASAEAAAEEVAPRGVLSSSGGGSSDGMPEGMASQQQQQQQPHEGQQAVLLFCRVGNCPYAFCGRLRLAAAAADESSGDGGRSSGSNGSAGCLDAGGPIVWELADAPAMLGGEAGDALAQLLFT